MTVTLKSVSAKPLKALLWTTSILNLLDNGLRVLAVLLVSPLIIGALGATNYGLWTLVLTWVGWFELLDLGMSNTAARYFSQAISERDTFRLAAMWYKLRRHYGRVSLTTVCLTWLTAGILHYGWDGEAGGSAAKLLATLGTTQGAVFFLRLYPALLKGHMEYRTLILTGSVRTVIHALLMILLYPDRLTLWTITVVHVLLLLLEQSVLVLVARRLVPCGPPVQFGAMEGREINQFALKNVVAITAQLFRERIDTQLLATFVSLQAVSHYAVGIRFPNMMMEVSNALFGGHLMSAFTAAAHHKTPHDLLADLQSALRFSACVGLFSGLGLILLGPSFILQWLGPDFADAGSVLRILMPGITLTVLMHPVFSLLPAINKHGFLALSYLGSAMLNFTLSWFLVQRMGLTGVVWATCVELCLHASVVLPLLVGKSFKSSPLDFFAQSVARPVALFAAAAGPLSWLWAASFDLSSRLGWLAAFLGYAVIGIASCWFLLLIDADRALARTQLRRILRLSRSVH